MKNTPRHGTTPTGRVNSTGPSKLSDNSGLAKQRLSANTDANSDNDFIAISDLRRKKMKNSPRVITGTGTNTSVKVKGISKVFISLPYKNNSYPLKCLANRIGEIIGSDTAVKIKKRSSSNGYTTPFEVYGKLDDLDKLFDKDLWEFKAKLALTENLFRLPGDYEEDDMLSEENVYRGIKPPSCIAK